MRTREEIGKELSETKKKMKTLRLTKDAFEYTISGAYAMIEEINDNIGLLDLRLSELYTELSIWRLAVSLPMYGRTSGMKKSHEPTAVRAVAKFVRWSGSAADLQKVVWCEEAVRFGRVKLSGCDLVISDEKVPIGDYLVCLPNGSICHCSELAFKLIYGLRE